MIRGQVNVIDLKAEVSSRVDSHGDSQQGNCSGRMLLGDEGERHQGQHGHVQADAVKELPRNAQAEHVPLLQCVRQVAE